MSTTAKKTTKKTALSGAAKTEKKVNYVIDPETGKKVHKRWINIKKLWAEGGGVEIVDMRAVLK
ncbi:MAG: hypothetical protein Q4B43_04385 [Bacteroidota bacterium]|nr:hypothetical protein [Bacteroidota bacterium]